MSNPLLTRCLLMGGWLGLAICLARHCYLPPAAPATYRQPVPPLQLIQQIGDVRLTLSVRPKVEADFANVPPQFVLSSRRVEAETEREEPYRFVLPESMGDFYLQKAESKFERLAAELMLDELQLAKLRLAAQGDWQRLVREARQVHAEFAGFGPVPMQIQKAHASVMQLNGSLEQGVTRPGSLCGKVLQEELSQEQIKRLVNARLDRLVKHRLVGLTAWQTRWVGDLLHRHVHRHELAELTWDAVYIADIMDRIEESEFSRELTAEQVQRLVGRQTAQVAREATPVAAQ